MGPQTKNCLLTPAGRRRKAPTSKSAYKPTYRTEGGRRTTAWPSKNKKTGRCPVVLFWRPQGDSNPCCRRERAVS
jgi:hypothetical protein